jgi:hypothetical protein
MRSLVTLQPSRKKQPNRCGRGEQNSLLLLLLNL